MSTGELLQRTGLTEHQLRGLLASRKIERPPVYAGRYVWPEGSVETVKAAAAVDLRRTQTYQTRHLLPATGET